MNIWKTIGHKASTVLARNPKILPLVHQAWLRFGYDVLDLRMASWVIRRPEWIRRRPNSEPVQLEAELPFEDGANSDIAGRLISLHHSMFEKDSNGHTLENSMWGTLRQAHYEILRSLVETRESAGLERYLARIFRTKTVNGYTYGSTFDRWPHRWHYLPVQIELSVVQLAEALGLIRAECHEQGEVAFWREICSEENLIGKLESFFGFRIEQPRCGDPRGIMFGGRFLTRETCSHLYSAYKIRLAIERKAIDGPLDIVEIGGGFGGTCYWLKKVMGDRVRRYAIVDLPEVNLVQAFFLGSVHPKQLVLKGETFDGIGSSIQLINYTQLDEIRFRPNILINQDSMPEMPETEVLRYLKWASNNLDGLFISFNQETYSMNGEHLQVLVPEAVKRFPRFRRISREASWDRRGYVEEIYETVS